MRSCAIQSPILFVSRKSDWDDWNLNCAKHKAIKYHYFSALFSWRNANDFYAQYVQNTLLSMWYTTLLLHWGRVTHLCVSKIAHHWPSSHYLNQCWNIESWALRNQFQRSVNKNSCISIQGNAFERGVCKMAAILSRPQCDDIDNLITIVSAALKQEFVNVYCEIIY